MSNKTVTVHLDSDGRLILQLPGFMNASREIRLRKDEAGETLVRILRSMEEDKTEIGLDGAPTQAQVHHWERHGIWPDERCRFCLGEGRIKPSVARVRKAHTVYKDATGIEVRRIAAGKGGRKVQRAKVTLEDLGLD